MRACPIACSRIWCSFFTCVSSCSSRSAGSWCSAGRASPRCTSPRLVGSTDRVHRGALSAHAPLEQYLRRQGGGAGYEGGFIEHYVTAAIYPSGLTRGIQLGLGGLVIALNAGIYWWWWRRRTAGAGRRTTRGTEENRQPRQLGLLSALEFFGRRIKVSRAPRPGAAASVPYDPVAMSRSPSLTWIGHSAFLVRMDDAAFLTDPMYSMRREPARLCGSGPHGTARSAARRAARRRLRAAVARSLRPHRSREREGAGPPGSSLHRPGGSGRMDPGSGREGGRAGLVGQAPSATECGFRPCPRGTSRGGRCSTGTGDCAEGGW